MNDEKKSVNVCRVCLTSSMKKCVSLFDQFRDYFVCYYINSIANTEIKEGDGLPDKICRPCLLDLETVINFQQKCKSSNVILRSSMLTKQMEHNVGANVMITNDNIDDEYQETDLNFSDDKHNESTSQPQKPRKRKALDPQVQCHDCGDYFKSKSKLRIHWKSIHLLKTLICQICKRTFKSVKAYENHVKLKRSSCIIASEIRIEGEGRSRVFHCKDCDYNSQRISDVKTHLVVHSGNKLFQCDICLSYFTQKSSMVNHKESVHKTYKVEINCQFCGMIIKGRTRIYRHLKSHTNQQVECDICKKIFKSKKILSRHILRHSGVKSYTCEKCAKTFYTTAELRNHTRLTHYKGKYWYKCDQCEYKSIRSQAVKKHKLRHTSHNVPCTVCGMFFESKQKLTLHELRHFGERKYPCPECDAKFYRKDSVRQHVRLKHKCTMLNNNKKPDTFLIKEECLNVSRQNIEIEFILTE